MQMGVPQGPGSALRFLSNGEEPSTCFTPNFEAAETGSEPIHFYSVRSRALTADFELTETETEFQDT